MLNTVARSMKDCGNTGDMLGQPTLDILRTPQQPFRTRQAANRRKRSRIACGVATNARDGLVEALRQLIDRQKDGRRCDR